MEMAQDLQRRMVEFYFLGGKVGDRFRTETRVVELVPLHATFVGKMRSKFVAHEHAFCATRDILGRPRDWTSEILKYYLSNWMEPIETSISKRGGKRPSVFGAAKLDQLALSWN